MFYFLCNKHIKYIIINITVCPFNRTCLLKGGYKARITKGNEIKEYIGSTGVSFKSRFNQYMHSFKPNKSTQTTLFKYFIKNR